MEYYKKIRELRLAQKMTQTELASGITSQSVISKIEKGIISPEVDLLKQLCERLNIDILDLLSEENDKEVISKELVDSILEKRDYTMLEQYIKTIDPTKLSHDQKNYYAFLEIVILSMNYADYEQAIIKSNEIIKEMPNSKKSDLELKANYYLILANSLENNGNVDSAIETLKEALSISKLGSVGWVTHLKILYSLTRIQKIITDEKLIDKGLEKGLEYSLEATDIAIKNNSIYLLEDIFLLQGHFYFSLENKEQSKIALNKAEMIASMKNNTRCLKQIELYRDIFQFKP